MNLSSKKGITVTSIVVYVILFFVFTTTAIVISSRFNRELFDDRGKAINITAINKLEYNLLKSAKESNLAQGSVDGNKTTITFSNSDVYIFDLDNHIIYKNGGKLVKFVKECKIKLVNNLIDINVTLNKYTNEITRNIKVRVPTKVVYTTNGLIAYYDGIDNVGDGSHDSKVRTWKDTSTSNVTAQFSSAFTNDGINDGWVEDGVLFPIASNDFDSGSDYNVTGSYSSNAYSSISFELTLTVLDELGTLGDSYIYPLRIRASSGIVSLNFAMRKNVGLMYGSGNSTVFYIGRNLEKDKTYTFTFVQENLTTRAIYLNGEFIERQTGFALNQINFTNIIMQAHAKGHYIIHSVRAYNRALTENEVIKNFNTDKLRYNI